MLVFWIVSIRVCFFCLFEGFIIFVLDLFYDKWDRVVLLSKISFVICFLGFFLDDN